MKKENKKRKGFTLVELMVVMAIIGILIAMLLPSITGYRENAQQISVEAGATSLETAITSYEIGTGNTYSAGTDLSDYMKNVTTADDAGNGVWGVTLADGTPGEYTLTPPLDSGITTTFKFDSMYAVTP